MDKQFFTLYNGLKIPAIGFGTWQIKNDIVKDACLTALKEGYRHIDTAKAYGNEKGVGESLNDSGLTREDVFIQIHQEYVFLKFGKIRWRMN